MMETAPHTHQTTPPPPRRGTARLESLVVTCLLGSTLVVAKDALATLGPLTLAALRYGLAFLCLLPLLGRRWRWSPALWGHFLAIGLSFYVVGNGLLVLGLHYLAATTTALLLSLVPLLVLLAETRWLRAPLTRAHVSGVGLSLGGSALFFAPGHLGGRPRGLILVAVGLLGNAAFGLLGRHAAQRGEADTVALTAIPLAIGSGVLWPFALGTEGWPHLSLHSALLVGWLAAVNTAAVFLLYNHALRVLPALEVSAVVTCAPLVTALLAWLVLGERLTGIQLVGLVVVVVGATLVQRDGRT